MKSSRTTKGACNSAIYFQACVELCLKTLWDNLLESLDDFALLVANETALLDIIARFLFICKEKNLVVSISKSRFFANSIWRCSKWLDADSMRLNPSSYEAIKNINERSHVAELSQFAKCTKWMSCAILKFSERVARTAQNHSEVCVI